MATYVVTTSNWNDPAFWAGLSPVNDDALDFTALGPTYSIDFDLATRHLTLSDGTTTFVVGDPGDTSADAQLGGTDVLAFDRFFTGDGAHGFALGSDVHVVVSGNGNDTVSAGDGNDTVDAGAGSDSLDLGTGADSADAGAGNDTVLGGDGNDTILGQGGADVIDGGGGGDSVDAGDGNDTFAGGAGNDTLIGGAGDDFIGNVTPNVEGGNDLVYGGAGNDTVHAGYGYDTIYGGDGDDQLYEGSTGGAGGALYGEGGNDSVYGGTGNAADYLDGGDGNDLVLDQGTAGNVDTLVGGAGNDTLVGGAGRDILTGGTGEDVYRFFSAFGDDTITDFDLADDNLDGASNDQFDIFGMAGSLRASDITVSDDGSGNALLTFPAGETIVVEGVAPAVITNSVLRAAGIPCFTPGTRIETEGGLRPVEALRPGDRLWTLDRGFQPVLWVGQKTLGPRELEDAPHLRPIWLATGAMGNTRPMRVSPQHAFLGGDRLWRARHLALYRHSVAQVDMAASAVTYVHLMTPQHDIIFADGALTETLYPGPVALRALGLSGIAHLVRTVPKLAPVLDFSKDVSVLRAHLREIYGPPAREYGTGKEARRALSAMPRAGKGSGHLLALSCRGHALGHSFSASEILHRSREMAEGADMALMPSSVRNGAAA